MKNEKRAELIENLIPSDSEYLFEDGLMDNELIQIQEAYSNLPEPVADDYLQCVLKQRLSESENCDLVTAKAFVESRLNVLKNALAKWEVKA